MILHKFEAWMAKMVHYVYYSDGWFWHAYKEQFGAWPTAEMKARGLEMRAEYSKGKQ